MYTKELSERSLSRNSGKRNPNQPAEPGTQDLLCRRDPVERVHPGTAKILRAQIRAWRALSNANMSDEDCEQGMKA